MAKLIGYDRVSTRAQDADRSRMVEGCPRHSQVPGYLSYRLAAIA